MNAAEAPKLHKELTKVIRERGIDPATAEAAQLEYLSPTEHAEYIGDARINVGGIGIPYHGLKGEFLDYLRSKVLGDFRPKGAKRSRRYLQRAGTPNRFYLPRIVDWSAIAKDASRPVIFTEGELKALKVTQEGFPCIGLGGVWNWRSKADEDQDSGGPIDSTAIADFNLLKWPDRVVYIIYDSDAITKPDVLRAELALARDLTDRGAKVHVVRLPHLPGQRKTGVDDWLKAKGKRAKAAFEELLGTATTPFILRTTSLDAIMDTKFARRASIVPGLLHVGMTTLSGPPKVRKSFLALSIAQAVATNGKALGMFPVTSPGAVLFVALEDTQKRIQDRWKLMRYGKAPDLHFVFMGDVAPGQAGYDMLRRWLEANKNARLVIIDTLQKFRGPADRYMNAYQEDVAALSPLKALADEFGIALLLIHHLRKGTAEDVFERVSGSTGITATADTNLVLLRERGQDDGTLHITGRDVEEEQWALHFEAGIWTFVGRASEVYVTKTQNEVLEAMRGLGDAAGPTEIARATGRKAPSLMKTLARMVADQRIEHVPGGKYRLAPERGPNEKF